MGSLTHQGKGRFGGLNPIAKTCNCLLMTHQGAVPMSDFTSHRVILVTCFTLSHCAMWEGPDNLLVMQHISRPHSVTVYDRRRACLVLDNLHRYLAACDQHKLRQTQRQIERERERQTDRPDAASVGPVAYCSRVNHQMTGRLLKQEVILHTHTDVQRGVQHRRTDRKVQTTRAVFTEGCGGSEVDGRPPEQNC